MKKILMTLCVVLGVSVMLSGCLKSDDETSLTTYGDMVITSFTLGTMNRYTESTSSSTGNDTIVKSTYTGSAYPMSIDQLGCRIFNEKELPVGTDLKHVMITLTTKNSGVVAIKSLTSDELTWYSSTDSIDFSQPRVLRVYAVNGSGYRDYTVTLNVSETTGINFAWKKVVEEPALGGWDDEVRLSIIRDTVYAVNKGVEVKNDMAFALENGQLLRSENLTDWQVVADASQLKMLVGHGTKELFALGTDGRMKHTEDDGLTWTDETLDTSEQLLPTEGLACASWNYTPSDYTDYVLLVGFHPVEADKMVIWRKISQYDGIGKGGQWVYMPVDETNRYTLPRQSNLSLACYKDRVLAIGHDLKMLESRDQGITWKTSSDYAVPSGLTGTRVCMTASEETGIWIFTNSGQVWHGTLR